MCPESVMAHSAVCLFCLASPSRSAWTLHLGELAFNHKILLTIHPVYCGVNRPSAFRSIGLVGDGRPMESTPPGWVRYSLNLLSIITVTGPSFTRLTSMWAPKTPR